MRVQELEVKLQNYWLTVAELRKAHHRIRREWDAILLVVCSVSELSWNMWGSCGQRESWSGVGILAGGVATQWVLGWSPVVLGQKSGSFVQFCWMTLICNCRGASHRLCLVVVRCLLMQILMCLFLPQMACLGQAFVVPVLLGIIFLVCQMSVVILLSSQIFLLSWVGCWVVSLSLHSHGWIVGSSFQILRMIWLV